MWLSAIIYALVKGAPQLITISIKCVGEGALFLRQMIKGMLRAAGREEMTSF